MAPPHTACLFSTLSCIHFRHRQCWRLARHHFYSRLGKKRSECSHTTGFCQERDLRMKRLMFLSKSTVKPWVAEHSSSVCEPLPPTPAPTPRSIPSTKGKPGSSLFFPEQRVIPAGEDTTDSNTPADDDRRFLYPSFWKIRLLLNECSGSWQVSRRKSPQVIK